MDLTNGKFDSGVEKLGVCPKCGSKGVTIQEDIHGSFYDCTYCGWEKDILARSPRVAELDLCMLDGKESYSSGK